MYHFCIINAIVQVSVSKMDASHKN